MCEENEEYSENSDDSFQHQPILDTEMYGHMENTIELERT